MKWKPAVTALAFTLAALSCKREDLEKRNTVADGTWEVERIERLTGSDNTGTGTEVAAYDCLRTGSVFTFSRGGTYTNTTCAPAGTNTYSVTATSLVLNGVAYPLIMADNERIKYEAATAQAAGARIVVTLKHEK